MSKIISPEQAAALVKDGAHVSWTTAGLCGFPEELAIALENRFMETGHPKDLWNMHSCGCGDWKTRGMGHIGNEGMSIRHTAAHIGEAPKLGALILDNKVACHLFPQGAMAHLFRNMAGRKGGLLTKVGLGTYADPRRQGGKINDITPDGVDLVTLQGEEYLYYHPLTIDVAMIRGTTCDEDGNMTMDEEPLFLEALHQAMAAKNNGGIVIAQVKYIAKAKTLPAKNVKVPGVLVDYIVIGKPENHLQTRVTLNDPSMDGRLRKPLAAIEPMALDERKVVGRRAALELENGSCVNMGIGMADAVAAVAAEEGVSDDLLMTIELGAFGGVPAKGMDFPAAINPDCIIDHVNMFDFYDGGGLDACFLGMAQCDVEGNINVSKFGPKVVGPGGFVNISSFSKKAVFCGTLTAGGAEYEVGNGTIKILKEGRVKKFVQANEHVTFAGQYAKERGQEVIYVTERAVFKLIDGKVTLIEIAPGMDVEKDIIAHMEFRPEISKDLKEMPKEIFYEKWGGLKEILAAKG
ncbi:MAG: acyl CoA:acetate/3-ketoacid CoA transferase [Desulfotomaculaceae bacterium]|nr:acyl CoA:acetate/3-ketoacid CoA transferase [Desulfotomaculaceae bacterium]